MALCIRFQDKEVGQKMRSERASYHVLCHTITKAPLVNWSTDPGSWGCKKPTVNLLCSNYCLACKSWLFSAPADPLPAQAQPWLSQSAHSCSQMGLLWVSAAPRSLGLHVLSTLQESPLSPKRWVLGCAQRAVDNHPSESSARRCSYLLSAE